MVDIIRIIVAFIMWFIFMIAFVITDDTTFGVWMVAFCVIVYGEVIYDKLCEGDDE